MEKAVVTTICDVLKRQLKIQYNTIQQNIAYIKKYSYSDCIHFWGEQVMKKDRKERSMFTFYSGSEHVTSVL
jgi:hemerythrin-like domain-containing protein